MIRFEKPRARIVAGRVRRRSRPTLEWLEDRRLLTVSTLGTTTDAAGNPVIFALQPGGAVVVNLERPTNNPTTPYQQSGEQNLPGLAAYSIAAFTDPEGEPAVVATTGPESYVYVNIYASTDNPVEPKAWTGWKQVSDFVATSVAASSNGSSGSAVFAIGTDTLVYENPFIPPTDEPAASGQFAGFQPLPGFSASSISVIPEGASTYQVAALSGPESYVDTTKATDTDGTIRSTPWTQLGNFVATSINLTPGLARNALGGSLDDPFYLFAVGADSIPYLDPLTLDATSGGLDSTSYSDVGDPSPLNGSVVATSAIIADSYFTVFASTSVGGVFENQITATGLASTPLSAQGWDYPDSYALGTDVYQNTNLLTITATSIAATPTADGGFILLARDRTGTVDSNEVVGHTAITFPGYTVNPDIYLGFKDLSTLSYHPIVTANGPGGLPFVLTIGGDGSVYVSQDFEAGTDGATDSYTGFEPLSGLTATSITATSEPRGLAVFALTGAQSGIYENQYVPTGVPTAPYAWSGWSQVGDIVATEIASATAMSSTISNGPTIFGLGVNGTIYASQGIIPDTTTGSNGETFSDFAPLPGITAATLSARAVGSQIILASLTGAQSYAYADLYTPSATPATTPATTSGWARTGSIVFKTLVSSENQSGAPVVFGISLTDAEYVSLSANMATASSGSSNDQQLYFPVTLYDGPSNSRNYNQIALGTLVYPSGAGVEYLDLVVLPNSVYSAGPYGVYTYPDTSTYDTPIGAYAYAAQTMANSPDGDSPAIYFAGSNGQIYVSQGVASGNSTIPYAFTTDTSLGVVPG